jgi:hypothetical protein
MTELKMLAGNSPAICALNYMSDNKVILAVGMSHIAVSYILQQLGSDNK